jgi:hypothetical protein
MGLLSTFGIHKNSDVVIRKSDLVEGRQTFTVIVDGKTMEHMYAEEIAKSLQTGVWEYNEDLALGIR